MLFCTSPLSQCLADYETELSNLHRNSYLFRLRSAVDKPVQRNWKDAVNVVRDVVQEVPSGRGWQLFNVMSWIGQVWTFLAEIAPTAALSFESEVDSLHVLCMD